VIKSVSNIEKRKSIRAGEWELVEFEERGWGRFTVNFNICQSGDLTLHRFIQN
jgi:hypothetical protein